MIVPLIVFLGLQRYFVRGLLAGGGRAEARHGPDPVFG